MLLRVGIIMVISAVALAVGVAVAVSLSGNREPAVPTAQRQADETTQAQPSQKRSSGERKEETDVAQLPIVPQDWPRPSGGEVAAAQGPRYWSPDQGADLTLTIEAIGLYDVPVINSNSEEALERGVIHVPQTPMPWDDREQKNVYLAGHRLGYPDTGSRLVFYDLDKLSADDSVVLKDRSGNTYEYRVSEVFVVDPNADWAVDPVRGRDMVTLQTCTMPDFENRLIVRADRV
jgi:sortase A